MGWVGSEYNSQFVATSARILLCFSKICEQCVSAMAISPDSVVAMLNAAEPGSADGTSSESSGEPSDDEWLFVRNVYNAGSAVGTAGSAVGVAGSSVGSPSVADWEPTDSDGDDNPHATRSVLGCKRGKNRSYVSSRSMMMSLQRLGMLSEADDAGPRAPKIRHWRRIVGKTNLIFHVRETCWTLAGDLLKDKEYKFS